MTKTRVLFIQGGGKGAHSEDAPLANSLKRALGPRYAVLFPRMPGEADPNVGAWKEKISSELSRIPGRVILVAHSVGGSILLRYLSEEKVQKPIDGLFLLAAPSWDGDRWNFDDLKLRHDISEKLAPIPRIFSTIVAMTMSFRSRTWRFTAHEFRARSGGSSAVAAISSATT